MRIKSHRMHGIVSGSVMHLWFRFIDIPDTFENEESMCKEFVAKKKKEKISLKLAIDKMRIELGAWRDRETKEIIESLGD